MFRKVFEVTLKTIEIIFKKREKKKFWWKDCFLKFNLSCIVIMMLWFYLMKNKILWNNKLIFYNRFDYSIPIQVLFNIRSFNVLNIILMTIKKYIYFTFNIDILYSVRYGIDWKNADKNFRLSDANPIDSHRNIRSDIKFHTSWLRPEFCGNTSSTGSVQELDTKDRGGLKFFNMYFTRPYITIFVTFYTRLANILIFMKTNTL